MDKKVIIINGSGGHGKDTVVDIMHNYANVTNVSSIDKIREAAKLLGCNGKSEKDRKFLSDLKILASNTYSHSIRYMVDRYFEFEADEYKDTIFFHIREPKEIEEFKTVLKALGADVTTLLVTRPSIGQITSNIADAGVYEYSYDYTIINDGDLKDLDVKVLDFNDWL